MESLSISGVTMWYERKRTHERVLALDDVSLTIMSGSFVSIVGPSGCGKSTLLAIIDGLVRPTQGEVAVDGHRLTGPGRDRAVVFQEASLFPWFTTLRNCGYGLECQGLDRKEAEARAAPLLAMVGLAGFEHHYPGELSVGMQQRANLARALAVNPDTLLMDEPFAALDAQTREFMQAELLDIWALTKKTVVFITHQIDEAIYLSDRVVVMSGRPGRILKEIDIDLPRPRKLAVKRTPGFGALEEQIWNLLAPEVRRAASWQSDDQSTDAVL